MTDHNNRNNTPTRVGIYARVSTSDQTCESQLRELREYVERRGWQITAEYVDTGWSGSKSSRPQLDRLMTDATKHLFDCVGVFKIDRFGRSVLHLNQQLATLTSYGIRFIAVSQGLDTDQNNPTARLLLHILASVAEFERELIRERVRAGIRNAKHHGKQLGRKRVGFDRSKALELHQGGSSIKTIAATLGVGVGTIHRALASAKVSSEAFQKPDGVGVPHVDDSPVSVLADLTIPEFEVFGMSAGATAEVTR